MNIAGPSTLVIPAFNEGSRIASVIEAARDSDPMLINPDYIVVVDNNSVDDTAQVASDAGAIVVPCLEQGKAPAIAAGVEVARSLGAKVLTYVDADLVGLTGDHLNALSQPVIEGRALMTIGYLGKRSDWLKEHVYKHWAMFSGQRALPIEAWDKLSARDLKGFRVEAALNSLFRNSGRGDEILRIELEGLSHTGKFDKYRLSGALMQYARVELSAIYGLSSTSSL